MTNAPLWALSTSHAHTTFVDGHSTVEEMALSAIEKGFQSLGFSEHAKQRLDPKYSLSDQSELDYIAEVKRLQEKYRGVLRIWLGLERDLLSTSDPALYDYFIASSHYFTRGERWFAADGNSADVEHGCAEFFGGDALAMARAYYDQLAVYIETIPPSIIGHFDLLTKNDEKLHLFDQHPEKYRNIVYEALERIVPYCDLLELNTGRMARGYASTPNPAPFILSRWRELGGRITVSSDCHDARHINYAYEHCAQILLDAGYQSVVALGANDALFVEYSVQ